jgi:hypothetical protein
MNAAGGATIGATRGKLAAVGGLAVVLVAVVASNFRGAAIEPAVAAAPEAVATPAIEVPAAAASAGGPVEATTAGAATTADPFGEFAVDADWPRYDLDKLVGFDPLAAPDWMASSEQAAATGDEGVDPEQSLKEIQEAQNAIILITGEHRVARIGSQEYHVGDMVGPYLITDISSAGIVLSDPTKDAADAQ